MSDHTPGPWELLRLNDGTVDIDSPEHYLICQIPVVGVSAIEKEANAQLIAAAPDLLEACEDTMRFLERYADPDSNELWAKVTAAIRKARGENQ